MGVLVLCFLLLFLNCICCYCCRCCCVVFVCFVFVGLCSLFLLFCFCLVWLFVWFRCCCCCCFVVIVTFCFCYFCCYSVQQQQKRIKNIVETFYVYLVLDDLKREYRSEEKDKQRDKWPLHLREEPFACRKSLPGLNQVLAFQKPSRRQSYRVHQKGHCLYTLYGHVSRSLRNSCVTTGTQW